MRDVFLTLYVLVWPALVALTLLVMCAGVYRDIRRAREDGESVV